MPSIRPFVGLLYDPAVAGSMDQLTAPPYDAITGMERDRLYAASPYNIVRLIKGRDEPGDSPSSNRNTRAAATFARWRQDGILTPTPVPAVFPYELGFHHEGRMRTVLGLIAEVRIEAFGAGIIPHERTLPGPVADRRALLKAVRANLSPVYSVFRGPAPRLATFLDAVAGTPADREAHDEAGTRHRLWVRPDGVEPATKALADDALMIADGHHRYAVALAYQRQMNATAGPGPWDWMMMLVVDATTQHPPVLPIHRVLRPRTEVAIWGRRVRDLAEVLDSVGDEDLTYGVVSPAGGGLIHRVGTLSGEPPTVRALHEQVLPGIGAGRFRYLPDAVAAETLVASGRSPAAFFLPPTRVDRLRAVIDRGERLPQKSTYFWPKPRTGMVARPFET